MASLAPSTLKQYDRPIFLWWEFCQISNTSIFTPPRRCFLEFLMKHLDKLGSYSSLNTYRSAVSLISNNNVGQDPLIKRFFKGVFSQKPPKPKYNETWDPSKVLDHLSTFYPNSELSFERLSKKLVVLLALITAQRVQALSLIRLDCIQFSETEVRIKIPDRHKTSGVNRNQPLLIIPAFGEKPHICPVETLREYLEKSKEIRSSNDVFLFIITREPYSHASSQTISRWIKSVLKESGIDEVFSSHSTRHASTSAAARRGLNIESIYRTAGWMGNSQVFARFYNRPLVDNSLFARSVCNL